MRRTLYALATLVIAAASAASAQARAIVIATLLPPAEGTRSVAVHVSNLLDDPEWLEPWRNAYVIQIHWRVQLWQRRFLGIPTPLPAAEWDVYVAQVPGIDLFNHAERINGTVTRTQFTNLDSLKEYLKNDIVIRGPRPLPKGDYFYRVDVRLSTAAEDPLDSRNTAEDKNLFQRLVGSLTNSGPLRDLATIEKAFKVP